MPSGAEITCPEKFIDFYSEAYFYDPATRDLKLESRMEEILKSDTWSRRDVMDLWARKGHCFKVFQPRKTGKTL